MPDDVQRYFAAGERSHYPDGQDNNPDGQTVFFQPGKGLLKSKHPQQQQNNHRDSDR
ncbi:hypothetical protein D3C81_2082390 [compost metagenome]